MKVGRSSQAQAAAIAHSGSLAGEDRATDAALRAAGVIRCDDLDELLETAELVEGARRLGRRAGRGRAGVVTVSTGEASLIADLAPLTGVDLPPVPDAARRELLERLPTLGYIGNPLDPWGATDPSTAYGAAFDAFAGSGAYDVLVLVDAVPMGEEPGTLAVIEPELASPDGQGDPGGAEPAPALDAHSMSPAVVLGMLSALGGDVGRVLVVGCQPAVVEEGIGLSTPVAAAVDRAVQMVLDVLTEICVPNEERSGV